ncbi:MAG: hypothetical protein RQ732_00290 [Methylophaga sp.]|nr:hypothetical protein [Methylophaga sp.]
MAADELKPTQPLSPGLPTDPAPEDHRRQPPKPPPEKPAEDNTESDKKRPPPDNLIDEYV